MVFLSPCVSKLSPRTLHTARSDLRHGGQHSVALGPAATLRLFVALSGGVVVCGSLLAAVVVRQAGVFEASARLRCRQEIEGPALSGENGSRLFQDSATLPTDSGRVNGAVYGNSGAWTAAAEKTSTACRWETQLQHCC